MAHYSITEAYKLLGISITSTEDEVQKRWRIVAKKYHPDLHQDDPNAKTKFKKYRDAYEVINTRNSGMKMVAAIEDLDDGDSECGIDGWLDELGITGKRREEIKREFEELGLEDE